MIPAEPVAPPSPRRRRAPTRLTTRRVTGGRLGTALLLALAAGMAGGGCGGGPTASTPSPSAAAQSALPQVPSSPTPAGQAAACALPPQAPPRGTISADYPTALAFAPDGRLFYAERSGAVRVWQGGAAHLFATVPTVTTERGGGYSERGLLGLAISPSFARDRFVYAFFSATDYAHQEVIRWTDCAGTGTGARTIVTLPSGGDCCHKGGRLAFGPDGDLYVTLGEEHDAPAAQSTGDVRGKVLRYTPDGSVPADNPFGAGNPVWAYGLRNPFGIAFSASGQLAVTDNGPSGEFAGLPATGYDIVILSVARGAGYRWPVCYGDGHPVPPHTSCPAGQLGPDWSSEAPPTVVPTGATFVDSSGPAGYAGHLVFCTFDAGMRILTPGTPHATVTAGPLPCRLDVRQGPDHALYYSDTGHVYRLG
jgi:aldose sugar dehydrogenase